MRLQTGLLATTVLLGAQTAALADTVTLRSGQKVDGTFLGGTARQVEFQDNKGKTLTLPVGEIAGMIFTAPPPPPRPPQAAGRAIHVPPAHIIKLPPCS